MGKTHGKHARLPERGARKRRIVKRTLVTVCACAVLLFAGVVAAYGIAQSTGRENLVQSFLPSTGSMATVGDNGCTVLHEGSKYHQRKDMTSILLMGHDGRQDDALNGQVDFIMVAAIDTSSGKTTLIYIPRDTMVDVQRTYDKSDEYADTVRMQIAAAFAYGSDFEHSAERMCETVSQLLFNISLNYYLMDMNVETLAGESVYNPETGYEEYHVNSAVALQMVLDVYFEKE